MKIAIMQPYFFPYIGYFQLMNAVDKFIFYDDVNFIKQGWINRNTILINGEKKYFGVGMLGVSSFKKINDIYVEKKHKKLLKTINNHYTKAPYFHKIFPLIQDVLLEQSKNIKLSDIAQKSIIEVANYLEMNTVFELSSEKYSDTRSLGRIQRILSICQKNKALSYINPINGRELYSKDVFNKKNVDLFFIKSNNITYNQFKNIFIPNLSIIDVMMFNSKEKIKEMLDNYKLL